MTTTQAHSSISLEVNNSEDYQVHSNLSLPIYGLLRATLTGAEAQGLNQNELADLLVPLLQPDDRELDTHEAAVFCNKADSTMERYRCQGKGPKYRRDENGLIRYRIGWLKDWLNQGDFVGIRESVI